MAKLVGMHCLQDRPPLGLVERKNAVNGMERHVNERDTSVDVPENKSVDLSWRNLTYHVTTGYFINRVKKAILQDVSGHASSGQLTVILGPSGSGKTTLLNIISGFGRGSYKGQVLVNGKYPSTAFYRDSSCFIPQETYLFPHLTVRQTVKLAAELKLPSSMKKAEKERKVDNVLQILRLTKVQSSNVTALSGGEKKRLFVAQDLVSNPPMMLLDEPTSGLDSSLSYECIKLLSDLAREGRTIVCSIHQPSSSMLEFFDNIHVLSKGHTIYSGPGRDLTSYIVSCGFECPQYYSPAEYIMDVASGVRAGEDTLLERWREESKRKQSMMNSTNCESTKNKRKFIPEGSFLLIDSHRYPTGFFHQFAILISRQFWSTLRRPALAVTALAATVALAGLFGYLYQGAGSNADKFISNVGFLAMVMIFLALTAILPSLLTFPSEKTAVLREYHNGWYSVNSYFLAKTIAGIPFNVIFPAVFTSMVYWLTEQIPEKWRIIYFVILAVCLTVSMESIPLIFGSLCSPKVTVFLVPALCLALLVVSTFFHVGNELPHFANWLTKVSPLALFNQGIMMVLYGFDRPNIPCSTLCFFSNPKIILQLLNVNDKDLYLKLGTLCATIPVLRVIGYLCLNLAIRRLK